MSRICVIFIFTLNFMINNTGTLEAKTDIDFNRIQPIPNQRSFERSTGNQNKLQVLPEHLRLRDRLFSKDDKGTEIGNQIYRPKQDPKSFYQSEIYKHIVNKNYGTDDLSLVVVGRNVQAEGAANLIYKYRSACYKCPNDITLIAKPGSNKVILQAPRIQACSGYRAPRHVLFKQMYGPQIGSLIEKGSHMIVGGIMQRNITQKLCKLQVHVITQGCQIPKTLIAHCKKDLRSCNFTCKNQRQILYGPKTLSCGSNMQWNKQIPICKAPAGCGSPPIPDHGYISCKGVTKRNGPSFLEGARCRVRCEKGWIAGTKPTSICRHGIWTRELNCKKLDY